MKPEHTKEFNAGHAQAGAPYAQRNGLEAEVGLWNIPGEYQLVGVRTTHTGMKLATMWTHAGTFNLRRDVMCEDLVMLPLGYCEGKPVFVGDELIAMGNKYAVGPSHRNYFDAYKWPRTKPNLPDYRTWFTKCWDDVSVFEVIMKHREEIEAYWKQLDEFNGVTK